MIGQFKANHGHILPIQTGFVVQGQRAAIFMTQPGQMKWDYAFEYGAPFIPDHGTAAEWAKKANQVCHFSSASFAAPQT